MLLNLCGEVMRQITTLIRIHEAATAATSTTRDLDPLFMKVDDIYELQTPEQIQTLTEGITKQAEPTTWFTGMSSNLQRFLFAHTPRETMPVLNYFG